MGGMGHVQETYSAVLFSECGGSAWADYGDDERTPVYHTRCLFTSQNEVMVATTVKNPATSQPT
jgi:hypothetical protein